MRISATSPTSCPTTSSGCPASPSACTSAPIFAMRRSRKLSTNARHSAMPPTLNSIRRSTAASLSRRVRRSRESAAKSWPKSTPTSTALSRTPSKLRSCNKKLKPMWCPMVSAARRLTAATESWYATQNRCATRFSRVICAIRPI